MMTMDAPVPPTAPTTPRASTREGGVGVAPDVPVESRFRVLSVLDSTDPRTGGPIEAERSRAAALNQVGASVRVISLDSPEAPWLSDLPFLTTACGPRRDGFGYSPRVAGYIRAALPVSDAVVVHGLWQYHGVAARSACREARRRYVVFPHGMLDPWFRQRYPLKHLKKQLFWWVAQYRVLRDAHAVLFTAEEERLRAEGQFWPYRLSPRVVGFGTQDPGPELPGEREAFAQSVPTLQGRPFVLFLGRIHEKKGPMELVQAYTSLPDLPFDLVLAGPGDAALVASLQRVAQQAGVPDRVHFPGMLLGPAKWGAFRSAEAFVLPSHQENFGIAVVEALACARPVLISNRVNIWREIEAGGAGLVRPDDLEGTRALLEDWKRLSPDAQARMGTSARSCFLKHFEISRSTEQYLDLLRECCPD